jgi:hypothetical protein
MLYGVVFMPIADASGPGGEDGVHASDRTGDSSEKASQRMTRTRLLKLAVAQVPLDRRRPGLLASVAGSPSIAIAANLEGSICVTGSPRGYGSDRNPAARNVASEASRSSGG